MNGWFGGKQAVNGGSHGRSVAPPPATTPIELRSQPTAAFVESTFGASDTFASYVDVGNFTRVLTTGERAIYALNATAMQKIVAVERVGRKAQIIVLEGDDPELADLIESLRGALITHKYNVSAVASAPAKVIAEIYTSASTAATTGSKGGVQKNEYMATVESWIRYAIDNRATDIHCEVSGSTGTVRFRIDGEIESMRSRHQGVTTDTMMTSCIATLYNSEQERQSGSGSTFDKNESLYCMVPYQEIPGHPLKLRFQSIKGNDGPKAVLRLLPVNENAKTLTFQELGYADSHIRLWNDAMSCPSGMVLIAGVTGSGKSTTLKSFIELNPNAPSSAIYTLEDPVEYPIRYTHQVPLQRDVGRPEESARLYMETVAALLRMDPDIGMLGELRDYPSAAAGQQLAETGHMALATVHAHRLSGIVQRLVNKEIGMSREVLTGPNMLTLAAYQALVAKLCPECAMHTGEAIEIHSEIGRLIEDLKELRLPIERLRWKRQGGCSHCRERGTVGQTVVAEMLMPDDDWLHSVREGRDGEAMMLYQRQSDGDLTSANMAGKTVFEHVLLKALNSEVDARAALRFENIKRFVTRHKALHNK